MDPADNATPDQQSTENTQPPVDQESFLDLIAATVVVVRQIWLDRVALVRAEARLAFKSVLLIALLLCMLGMVMVLAWAVLMVALAYYALLQGMAWWLVAAVLFLSHIVLGFCMWWRIDYLSRYLRFSATRQAFSKLSEGDSAEGAREDKHD